jgi:hypothetical protein
MLSARERLVRTTRDVVVIVFFYWLGHGLGYTKGRNVETNSEPSKCSDVI